jgi:hypothetical protein
VCLVFGVGIGYQVKVKFCSDRNAISTSGVAWGTTRVQIQGVLRGITGLGVIVCCCNVTDSIWPQTQTS